MKYRKTTELKNGRPVYEVYEGTRSWGYVWRATTGRLWKNNRQQIRVTRRAAAEALRQPIRRILLECDEEDYAAIQKELAQRQAKRSELPEGYSNLAAAHLAECCRDIAEYRQLYEQEHPR